MTLFLRQQLFQYAHSMDDVRNSIAMKILYYIPSHRQWCILDGFVLLVFIYLFATAYSNFWISRSYSWLLSIISVFIFSSSNFLECLRFSRKWCIFSISSFSMAILWSCSNASARISKKKRVTLIWKD